MSNILYRLKFPFVFASILCIGLVAIPRVTAQNFLDNDLYRQARDYQQRAIVALSNGEYEKSIEYSQLSIDLSIQAQQYARLLAAQFRAQVWKNRAEELLRFVEDARDPAEHIERYQNARAFYADGERLFVAEQYPESEAAYRDVVSLLEGIRSGILNPPLPRFFLVRLIPSDRDTLSKIAGLEKIYGDREKWPILYEANKHQLKDPNNPHLIHPGQLFEIPSVGGEKRTGTWEE